MVRYAASYQHEGDRTKGITYYVGGAGPIGHVGSMDVPAGLYDAGYLGFVEVFTWQGISHAGDQINLSRNRQKAAELAFRIRQYCRLFPDRSINIIALSAGTGVAAFALESLPDNVQVDNVVFLGCSLSSLYDLTEALEHIRGNLYVIYSPTDRILRDVVWYTGTVDRRSAAQGVAGLEGFRLPPQSGPDTRKLYEKLHNVPFRWDFAEMGYGGGHSGATSRPFVQWYIAPALNGDGRRLLGEPPQAMPRETAATQPAKATTSAPAPAMATPPAEGTAGQPAAAPTSRPTTAFAPS
ncbi:MAG: hypothetical protein ABII12_00125 [Planctomycetota bacterium]